MDSRYKYYSSKNTNYATRDLMPTRLLDPGFAHWIDDEGDIDQWSGTQWVNIVTGGATSVVVGDFQTKITLDGADTYIAHALVGTAEATAGWKAFKLDANGSKMYADGDANYDNVATDLTALTYSYT